jgi:hypothetical protein
MVNALKQAKAALQPTCFGSGHGQVDVNRDAYGAPLALLLNSGGTRLHRECDRR